MAALAGRTTIRFWQDQTNDFVSVNSLVCQRSLTPAAKHAMSSALGLVPLRPELRSPGEIDILTAAANPRVESRRGLR